MGVIALVEQATPTAVASQGITYPSSTTKRMECVHADGRVARFGDSSLWNYIRNGGFWFCQRQGASATNCVSTTLRAGGGLTGLDGWGIWNENANTTAARTDTSSSPETGLNSRFYGTFLKVTSTGKFFLS